MTDIRAGTLQYATPARGFCKRAGLLVELRPGLIFTGRGTNNVIAYRTPIWFAFDALTFDNRVSLEPKQQFFFSNFNRCV